MERDLAEQFHGSRLFQEADEVLGRKLSEIAWHGPIEELTKTSNCQPALFVHGLACLSILREVAGAFPVGGAAGLSLGEMTAHAAAGTFDFATGLKLVQRRGELMDEACAATNGAMAAMIGADESAVRALAAAADVDVANINSPGQIVISGEKAKVEIAIGLARSTWDSSRDLADRRGRVSFAFDGKRLPKLARCCFMSRCKRRVSCD
jgi:[acyl-carrier-protein] S-malonyltransferase